MKNFKYPVINLKETGKNIKKLREVAGLSVKELQDIFGFESPQAIYKWQWGRCVPSIDNLIVLARLFNTTLDKIIAIGEIEQAS